MNTDAIAVILIAALLLGQIATMVAILKIKKSLEEWARAWGQNPLHASDYHAKETWKTLQEIAHYLAVDHLRKEDRNPSPE